MNVMFTRYAAARNDSAPTVTAMACKARAALAAREAHGSVTREEPDDDGHETEADLGQHGEAPPREGAAAPPSTAPRAAIG